MTRSFDLYQHVTDSIIASVEFGTPAWRKPWTGEKGGAPFPLRSNGEPYSGINVLMLWLAAIEPMLTEAFAQQGTVLLGGYRYPQQVIFTTFELNDLQDLSGHKIRVTSPEQGEFISAFGGAPITLSGSDVPTSLERGVIDGVLTASAGGAKNWGEFLPYNMRFAVNYGNSVVIANADMFDGLKPANQEALRKIVAEEGDAITADFLVDEQDQMQKQKAAGMTIIEPAKGDAETAREKMTPYWSSWAEANGPEYVEALKLVRDAIGK